MRSSLSRCLGRGDQSLSDVERIVERLPNAVPFSTLLPQDFAVVVLVVSSWKTTRRRCHGRRHLSPQTMDLARRAALSGILDPTVRPMVREARRNTPSGHVESWEGLIFRLNPELLHRRRGSQGVEMRQVLNPGRQSQSTERTKETQVKRRENTKTQKPNKHNPGSNESSVLFILFALSLKTTRDLSDPSSGCYGLPESASLQGEHLALPVSLGRETGRLNAQTVKQNKNSAFMCLFFCLRRVGQNELN